MSSVYGGDKSTEFVFQNDMIEQMVKNGWQLGKPEALGWGKSVVEQLAKDLTAMQLSPVRALSRSKIGGSRL